MGYGPAEKLATWLTRAAYTLTATDLPPGKWITSDFDRLTEGQFQSVWTMLRNSYERVGVPLPNPAALKSKYKLLMVEDTDGDQLPNAFIVFKPTRFGNKITLIGTDGQVQSKKVMMAKIIELLQRPGWYIESSHRPAQLLEQSGIDPIRDQDVVETVLREEAIEWLGDGAYMRNISGVGRVKKSLYGNPLRA